MAKGGESLGNEEGSEEEEEVIPVENHTPRVRLLTLGVVYPRRQSPTHHFPKYKNRLPYDTVVLRLSARAGKQAGNQEA